MKKILFISQEFYPISNGTVSCTANIINELAKYFDVTLYTGFHPQSVKTDSVSYNVFVKRPKRLLIDYLYYFRQLSLVRLTQRSGVIYRMMYFIYRLITLPIEILDNVFGYSSYYGWCRNIHSYIKEHEDLSELHAIIAIASPFSNFVAAVNLKKLIIKVKLILIEMDLYTDNTTLYYVKSNKQKIRKKYLSQEEAWFKEATAIIILEEMSKVILSSELSKYKSKITALKTPVMIIDKQNNNVCDTPNIDSRDIVIVYTGRFYEDIRNPTFSLEVISRIVNKDSRMKFHIYGYGCENIINRYRGKNKENIVFHGKSSREEVIIALKKADILFNLSNSTTNQAPSKIFEYIGYRKPIVNIFSVDNDRCVEVLRDYPLSISIKEDINKYDKISDELYKFIIDKINNKVSVSELASTYYGYSPESFVDRLRNIL